jgi:hypothetical protein
MLSVMNVAMKTMEATEFKQIVGSLIYLCDSRPDICFAVSIISRIMNVLEQNEFNKTTLSFDDNKVLKNVNWIC